MALVLPCASPHRRLLRVDAAERSQGRDARDRNEQEQSRHGGDEEQTGLRSHVLQRSRRHARRKYPLLGIEVVAGFGRNHIMNKLICCFAIVLAGCHGVHRPLQVYYPPASQPAGGFEPNPAPESTPVTVAAASLPLPEAKRPEIERRKNIDEAIADVQGRLEDAYFAYDRYEPSAEAVATLRRDAELLCTILAELPDLKVTLEGHCDERGSAEYNLALGDRRARRAAEILQQYCISPQAVEIVSYGKEAPQCLEANESCLQKNRRAHISLRKVAL
jgi:peptidoglycan-associated lipoprotein